MPTEVAYSQGLDFSGLAAAWLPMAVGLNSPASADKETLATLDRGSEEPYAAGLLTQSPKEVKHQISAGAAWRMEEDIEVPDEPDDAESNGEGDEENEDE